MKNVEILETRKHKEAYAIMKYGTEDYEIVEWLWNSRDGVTPFIIGYQASPGGGRIEMHHLDWQEDAVVPNFVPPLGMRVFIDANNKGEPTIIMVDAQFLARLANRPIYVSNAFRKAQVIRQMELEEQKQMNASNIASGPQVQGMSPGSSSGTGVAIPSAVPPGPSFPAQPPLSPPGGPQTM